MSAMLKSAAIAIAITALTLPASAKCTKLAFSVNDYGKDGPIKDAKELLDKYIAKEMAAKGIKTYRVGKKDVTCELFLDVGFFDEHTCKAAAVVCWGDGTAGPAKEAAVPAGPKPADASAQAKAEAKKPAAVKAKAQPKEAAPKPQ